MIAREEYAGGRVFEVVAGNLLEEPVEAIVNAANGHLAHGGGVAAAIARAAGPALVEEGDRIVAECGPVPVGEAVVTAAGRLPFKAVIHAVGPHQGLGQEEDRLVQALGAAFRRAHERGFTSLSFPAVSSGIFAVPLETCARAYVRAVRGFFAAHPETSLRTVRLCLFPGPLADLVRAELSSSRGAPSASGMSSRGAPSASGDEGSAGSADPSGAGQQPPSGRRGGQQPPSGRRGGQQPPSGRRGMTGGDRE